jgi:hypothetical protein
MIWGMYQAHNPLLAAQPGQGQSQSLGWDLTFDQE